MVYLRSIRHIFCTMTNKSNCFHTCVWESCIARKFRQTFHCILERINGRWKVFFKYKGYKGEKYYQNNYHFSIILNCTPYTATSRYNGYFLKIKSFDVQQTWVQKSILTSYLTTLSGDRTMGLCFVYTINPAPNRVTGTQ